jgi:hypothetical protein
LAKIIRKLVTFINLLIKTMKIITVSSILFILVIMNGCTSQDERRIKKDISSRFTGFEIVEIKADSANIEDAFNTLNSLKIIISQGNLDIIKAGNHFYNIDGTGKWSDRKTKMYMDSITSKMSKICYDFMRLQLTKPEACYYVNYRIYNGAVKEVKEEYYKIRSFDSGKQIELIHRPVNWNEYLIEQNSLNICHQCIEEQIKFLREQIYGTN